MFFPTQAQKILGAAESLPQIPRGFNLQQTNITAPGKKVTVAIPQTDRKGNKLSPLMVPITLARMGLDALVICTVNEMRAHLICSLDSKIDLGFEVHRFLSQLEKDDE